MAKNRKKKAEEKELLRYLYRIFNKGDFSLSIVNLAHQVLEHPEKYFWELPHAGKGCIVLGAKLESHIRFSPNEDLDRIQVEVTLKTGEGTFRPITPFTFSIYAPEGEQLYQFMDRVRANISDETQEENTVQVLKDNTNALIQKYVKDNFL